MHVRSIEFGSAEYRAHADLRRRFLREPLGLDLTDEDVVGEESQHHVGLFDDDGRLVGGLIGKPDDAEPDVVRLRQVVVHPDRRGGGHGRLLLTEAERLLAELGYSRSVLYARDESAPFYERCGYHLTGETAELIGLPHLRMEKGLL